MNNEQTQRAQQLGLMAPGHGRFKRWLLVLLVIATGLAVALWFWLRPQESSLLYKTAPAQRMDISLKVSATGQISPKDQVEVSSELSGIVSGVYVDFNDSVKQGQLLAELDISKLNATVLQKQSSLRSAQAQVTTARANLEEAQLNYNNYQDVWKSSNGKHPSRQTMDNTRIALQKAKASLEQALASVENAKADLEYAETDREKSKIVSPIDGIVLSRSIEVGQTVASSLSAPTLFLLARDLRDMELLVNIDEADIGQIREGQSASFTVDAYPGRRFNATVVQIRLASSASGSSGTSSVVSYQTVLKVDNKDLLLLPGMTAVTDIQVQSAADTLAVENAALRYRPASTDDNTAPASRTPQQGGIMGALTPQRRPPGMGRGEGRGERRSGDTATGNRPAGERRQAVVHVLRDNQPIAVTLTTGISNGTHTQVVSGELQEGDLVISDAVQVRP